MSKHAPGPWKVTSESHNPLIECEDGYVIAQIKGVSLSVEGFDCEANARLIAAAPRMYELLVEARKIVRDMPPDWNYQWDVLAMAIRNLLDEIDGQEDSHA
jgi:hypothetical protein